LHLNLHLPLWRWAWNDLWRRPSQPILSGLGLIALVLVTAAALLVVESLILLHAQALDRGPSVVVRRVEGDRWAPFAADEAKRAARQVRGVVRAGSRAAPGREESPGVADELTVDVFHETEEDALLPDLTAALGWPARAVTRTEARGIAETEIVRRSSLFLFVLVPALLALIYLVTASAREQQARRLEIGLLRAVGWRSGDFARLFLARVLLIGAPATFLGFGGALLAVFGGVQPIAARLVFAAQSVPQLPVPEPGRLLAVGATVCALVALPWALGVLWPLFRLCTADPGDLLDEARR
jgi:hypothetical protein